MELEVRLCQMNPVKGDIRSNTEKIISQIEKAEQHEAELAVFPEMAITGYFVRDLLENDSFVDENIRALESIAEETGETPIIVGFVDSEDGKLYNSAAVLRDGEVQNKVRKQLLPGYSYFDDPRYFDEGGGSEPIELEFDEKTVSIGLSICEDMWSSDYDRNPLKKLESDGADVFININASPYRRGKETERNKVIQSHIERSGLPFVYLNSAGGTDTGSNIAVFEGRSTVYESSGEVCENLSGFEEEFSTVSVSLSSEEYSGFKVDPDEDLAAIRAIEKGLKDYCSKNGIEKAIQPVSGGIDSSLGLVLTTRALGAENVVAYNLPSEVNSDETREAADKLADNLGVEYRDLPVESVKQEFVDVFEQEHGGIENPVAEENLYARSRAVLMMLVSNESQGSVLVSNANRTELGLGYTTLYGDMASGISIIGDLNKKQVYRIARRLNRMEDEPIPEAVFEMEPSAELSRDQSDPFDYDLVSPAVDRLMRGASVQDLKDEFLDGELDWDIEDYSEDRFEEAVRDCFERMKNSAFKRQQASPIISVSKKSFGNDFREPLINNWDG